MSFSKDTNKENALVLNTPKRNELLKEGPPRECRRQILGRGAYGTVFKAIYRERQVAVKIIRNQTEFLSTLHNEAHVLHLKHRNIVSLIKLESTPEFGLIIMERPNGQCLQRVLDTLALPLVHRVFITLDILTALRYCHSQYLLHLDVKPPNILVAVGTKSNDAMQFSNNYKRRYLCKLCDFGSSIRLDEFCARQCSAKGTLRYMSPEALRAEPLSCASDIYSLGITMWQLQTRRLPYHTLNCNESIAYQVVKHDLRPDDYGKLEALKLGSDYVNFASCYCAKRGISFTCNSRAVYENDIETTHIVLPNALCKKVNVLTRRSLNFETKLTRHAAFSGCRKHRRLAHYFDNPMPMCAVYLENAYTALYRRCWVSTPELRSNSFELQANLEQILAKCFSSNVKFDAFA